MTIDDKDTTNGHHYHFNCNKEPKTEPENGCELLLDGSSGSAEGLRMYSRRKRRKMSNSDDKIKTADNSSVADQDNRTLSFDAFTNGPGECSFRHCSNNVLQQMHQSLNGHENGLRGCIQNTFVIYQESGCMPVNKKSLDNVERSDNQTNGSTPELSRVKSCGLLKQSEGSTSTGLCRSALSDVLNSDEFSQLRGLLLKNFGVDNANRVLGIDAISLKIENGAYETSPTSYHKDIQQVWTKFLQVCKEMVTLAHSLSDKSGAHYEQFIRKPGAAEPRVCQGCEQKAEVRDCLVCDSCEDVYHLSCTELVGTQIPPLNWYCASCVSNGLGSPHDNCVVCEKLKAAAPMQLFNGVPTTDQSQDAPNGSEQHLHDVKDENQSSHICFICKLEVKSSDHSRTCGNFLCVHKFYHYNCLTNKQLGVWGPCWYCPSCLCRNCLVDKDDDQIVLCDSCDEAYHIYCASPQLLSIPKGSWFCKKCDKDLKRLRNMKRVYENMQKKVKIEDGSENVKQEEAMNERQGLHMLLNAMNMRHESF